MARVVRAQLRFKAEYAVQSWDTFEHYCDLIMSFVAKDRVKSRVSDAGIPIQSWHLDLVTRGRRIVLLKLHMSV